MDLFRRVFSLVVAVFVVAATGLVISAPAQAAAIATANQLDAGYDHACVLSGTQIYCWGRNNYGQLGNGTTTDSATPVLVSGGQTWASFSAGAQFSCALTTAGAAYCWGRGDSGQLGVSGSANSSTPVVVNGGYTWLSLSVGDLHACGIVTGGAAYCWGINWDGRLGIGGTTSMDTPTIVTGSHSWTSISAGETHTCGIVSGGAGYCWGANGEGAIGDNTTNGSDVPVAVSGGHTFSALDAGSRFSCGIESGTAYCWGYSFMGAAGSGTYVGPLVPTAVSGGATYISIDAGYAMACAVTSAHATQCWGSNSDGGLGNGTGVSDSTTPVVVSGSLSASKVATTGAGACLLTTLSLVYCWGYGIYGTLGDGGSSNVNVPVGVIGFANLNNNSVVAVSIDSSFTFSVSARASTCNGESNFTNVSSASAIPLGHLAAGANVSSGQTLTAAGNSGAGFSVFVRGAQSANNLRSSGHNWTDVTGTYASPAALGSGERFGYTYKDSTSSTSVTNPGSALFIALDATNRAVMGSASSSGGSGCISFDAQTAAATPAAAYSATIIYTAVPAF